jgi:hypothetical protein
MQELCRPLAVLVIEVAAEAHAFFASPFSDNVLKTDESAAADKQNISCIHLQEFLLRVLSPPFRGNARHGSFDDL